MLKRLRGPRRDDGVVMVMVALLLVGLFGISALVLDLGYARQESRHVQASSDAAALAGSRELPINAADSILAAEAKKQAARYVNLNVANLDAVPPTTPCASSVPPNSTCYVVEDATVVVATPYALVSATAPPSYNLVYVKICEPTPTFFAGVVGGSSPTVCRDAVARRRNVPGDFNFGLVVMDPNACAALQFRGDSTTQLSSNGAVMVNSSCRDVTNGALDSSGSSWNLVADYIGVVGHATLAPCDPALTNTCTSTVPTEGIPHFDSPLTLSPPSPLPALSTTSACAFVSGTNILQPGRYPTRCDFEGNRQYIFRPGTYYFDQGFRSAGSAPLVCSNTATTYPLPTGSTCDGVTFIIGGSNVELTGGGQVHLPAPTTGDYAGVSIYQISSDTSIIDGSNNFNLGTIYAPNATLTFTGSGGGDPTTGDYVNITGMVIGKKVDIAGNFYFNIQVPADGTNQIPEDDIGLET